MSKLAEEKVVDLNELRGKIRSKTVGAKRQFKAQELDLGDGVTIEVRQPSIRARSLILAKSRIIDEVAAASAKGKAADSSFRLDEMQVWACIECCYVPGTNEHVFTEEDHDGLAEMEPGSVVDQVWDIVQPWMNVKGPEEAKNS